MKKRVRNWSLAVLGVLLASFILAAVGETAMRGVYGFAAVAANNRWQNIKDFSIGDNITEGAMLVSPCMYDGTNCDRLRGDTTNGLDVDVTRVGGTVTTTGGGTPADNAANPTTALITDSRISAFDGTTWDRLRGNSVDGLDVKVTNASAIGGTVKQLTLLNAVTTAQLSLNTDLTTLLCSHSWTTVLTGAPTGVTVAIEGSLDGIDWFTLDTNNSTSNAMRHFADTCFVQVRANLSVLTGGTSPTVTIKTASK